MVIDGVAESTACDVAIVGGGIGGLTVGALLARAGAHVVVCEQHSRAGGYCHCWHRVVSHAKTRLRFTFDAAVHDISGAWPKGPVQTILGWLNLQDQLEWRRVSHEYCFPFGTFPVDVNPDAYIATLKRRFPLECAGIDSFFQLFRQSYEELYSHATAMGGIPRAPRNSQEMRCFREQCPTLARLVGSSFVDLRNSLLHDPDLRQLVSILSAYVTDDVRQLSFAQMLPLFGYYFRGGYYPRGGSQALADALANSIIQAGGRVRLRTPVSRILLRNERAIGLVLRNGAVLRANIVISNADPRQTVIRLIDAPGLPARLTNMASMFRPSNSAFLVFLALDIDQPLAESTILVHGGDGVIISRPPFPESRSPAGYTTVTLTSLIGTTQTPQWDRVNPKYDQMKREMGDRLIALAARRLPEIVRHVVYREDASPGTLYRYSWATSGAAYGATPGTRCSTNETPIRGLYFVGALTELGPGIEAVMVGAASLAEQLGFQVAAGRSPTLQR